MVKQVHKALLITFLFLHFSIFLAQIICYFIYYLFFLLFLNGVLLVIFVIYEVCQSEDNGKSSHSESVVVTIAHLYNGKMFFTLIFISAYILILYGNNLDGKIIVIYSSTLVCSGIVYSVSYMTNGCCTKDSFFQSGQTEKTQQSHGGEGKDGQKAKAGNQASNDGQNGQGGPTTKNNSNNNGNGTGQKPYIVFRIILSVILFAICGMAIFDCENGTNDVKFALIALFGLIALLAAIYILVLFLSPRCCKNYNKDPNKIVTMVLHFSCMGLLIVWVVGAGIAPKDVGHIGLYIWGDFVVVFLIDNAEVYVVINKRMSRVFISGKIPDDNSNGNNSGNGTNSNTNNNGTGSNTNSNGTGSNTNSNGTGSNSNNNVGNGGGIGQLEKKKSLFYYY